MTIRFDIRVEDEIGVESSVLFTLLGDIEGAARNAAVAAIRETLSPIYGAAFTTEVPFDVAIDAIAYRIHTSADDLVWIEEIGQGSKWLAGILISGVIAAIIRSTIGASIEQGWKETETHQAIVETIPKIEDGIAKLFGRAMDGQRELPPTRRRYDAIVQRQRVQ